MGVWGVLITTLGILTASSRLGVPIAVLAALGVFLRVIVSCERIYAVVLFLLLSFQVSLRGSFVGDL